MARQAPGHGRASTLEARDRCCARQLLERLDGIQSWESFVLDVKGMNSHARSSSTRIRNTGEIRPCESKQRWLPRLRTLEPPPQECSGIRLRERPSARTFPTLSRFILTLLEATACGRRRRSGGTTTGQTSYANGARKADTGHGGRTPCGWYLHYFLCSVLASFSRPLTRDGNGS